MSDCEMMCWSLLLLVGAYRMPQSHLFLIGACRQVLRRCSSVSQPPLPKHSSLTNATDWPSAWQANPAGYPVRRP